MSATVLVTDGEERAALAAVRSLGRAGHRAVVVSATGRSLAGASRHASAQHAAPTALADPDGFGAEVERIARAERADVLLPISEAALLALLPRRRSLEPCRIPFPDLERVRAVSDKARVTAAAAAAGVAVPEQVTLRSPADLAVLDSRALAYPLVVKPARSVIEGPGGRLKLGVLHVSSAEALDGALRALPEAAYPLLLQRRIVGPGVGVFLLLWGGELVAAFAHRRIREKPPSGGVSVYRESVALDPGLLARSRALLERFGWEGVAMIEYKLDAATGTPYLMEINGRFWGSLQLAVDAGVDFPALLVSLALGRRPEPVLSYRVGVRSRWWLGDLDHLLARLRHSPSDLALPPGSPGRLRAALDFLTLWRPGDRSEIFRWSDPRPGLREALQWLQGR